MSLEPEVEQYYNTYFDLFQTEGWKQFMADSKSAAESVNNILTPQDAKELHLLQGQLQVFQRLLMWEDSISLTYESLQEDSQEED
jgi:superfamily II RNA helicase